MRKSASEVIRSLEMRVARLERQASENHIKSTEVVKILSQLRIKLPLWEEAKGMKRKEVMTLSNKVGRALGDNWAGFLLRHGEIVLSGVDVLPATKPSARWWAGLVCSKTGKFIAVDGRFQTAFINGFKNSEWINEYNLGVAEQNANYDEGDEVDYIDAEKLARGIDFTARGGSDLVISIKR